MEQKRRRKRTRQHHGGHRQPDDGNPITISVNSDRRENNFWFLANQVDLTITVPENVELVLQNNTGAINISEVKARALDIQSNTGSITFDGEIGPDPSQTFSIQTNTGTITVSLPAKTSAKLDARSDTGSVTVSSSFDQITDVSENHSGVGAWWTGHSMTTMKTCPRCACTAIPER